VKLINDFSLLLHLIIKMVDNRSNGKSETNKKLRQIARFNLNSTREEAQLATGSVNREPTLNVMKKSG
jgi:hypothetical protein